MIRVVKRETRYIQFDRGASVFVVSLIIRSKKISQMEVIGLSGETEIAFSKTEMEAAEQLVQLSEEDSLSCSSGTGWSVCGGSEERGRGDTNRQEDAVSSKINDMFRKEQNDGGCRNKNVTDGRSCMKAITETKMKRNKKNKFRSLASIYKATKEITSD